MASETSGKAMVPARPTPAEVAPPGQAKAGPAHAPAKPTGKALAALAVAAIGVVYGDIGTSPLYAMRECFHGEHGVPVTRGNVLGVVSLIFWALTVTITIKYLVFILRADNRGEGGILALAALVTPVRATAKTRRWLILILGLFGAALLYADGMITPAITVLSAVEGLSIATPLFTPYVEGITVAILIGLFMIQSHGTARVGALFGPVMILWFLVLAAMGLWHVARDFSVIAALNPEHAFRFFAQNGLHGFLVLGSVFLVVTGGEALYADIGHFGVRPIRAAWFALVLPSLLLNYFGQAAFLLANPKGAENPLYLMAPNWALYPLVALATAAAVIASQAIITGAYSLTLQAVQLGYCPRVTIFHTSWSQIGQIYIPTVNWALMIACIGLVLGFQSSSNLAAAYGVAITITMVITTVLFFVLERVRWRWPLWVAVPVTGCFLVVDIAFFGANIVKVHHGGWFPLLVAAGVFTLMSTWRRGRKIVYDRMRERMVPLEDFLKKLDADPPARVPGTAVFLFSNAQGTPPALRFNVTHNKVLHETVLILTIETEEVPHVPPDERVKIEKVRPGIFRLTATYGFMDEPHIPNLLRSIPEAEKFAGDVSYFLGRESLVSTPKKGMARWREHLFVWMSRNAQHATAFFNLPADRVVELGVQVEL
jgi:KUP system potassium uptake protein